MDKMKNSTISQRRSFLKKMSSSALLAGAAPSLLFGEISAENYQILEANKKMYASNENIQIATIGMGIQGFNDTRAALEVPGVKLVAVCDLYDGRLKKSKEVFGDTVSITKDYLQILERDDVDAVLSLIHI